VTLCIAAACQYRNKPRIIICTDWKVSSSYGSAENTDKMRWIKKPNWVALTAGGATACDALVRMYRQSLSNEEITEGNALGVFTRVAHGGGHECVYRDGGSGCEFPRPSEI
jgi:20S proteasome alpha/beta subunit